MRNSLSSSCLLFLFVSCFPEAPHAVAEDPAHFYTAPEKRESGSGTDRIHAAHYLEPAFWSTVRERLQEQPVTVHFAAGEYDSGTLTLRTFGHPDHPLVLEGDTDGGTVFTGDVHRHIQIRGARNITLRHFNFTGETRNFAIHIVGYPADNPVEHLVLEHCRFQDLPLADRGAVGIAGRVTELTIRDSRFERIGESAHAHMIYSTSSGPGALRFHNNHFIDTPGDYLRLRSRRDYAEIKGNTFISNSARDNRPFVALIAFNQEGRNEVIGDKVHIEGNLFRYHPVSTWSWDRGIAICLSGYGQDPELGMRYMLKPEEARTLEKGSLDERRTLLREVMKIDPDTLRIKDNTYENIRYWVGFGSRAAEGKGHGWEGFVDLAPVIKASGNR